MLVYLWALLAATPWGFIADKYKSNIALEKLKSAGQEAAVGRVRMAMIPTQKMFFQESEEGLYLGISGLARHLGFVPVLIPWNKFNDISRRDTLFDLKLTEPKTTITIPAKMLAEAERKILSKDAIKSSNLSSSDDVEQMLDELLTEPVSVEPETPVSQPSEPLPRAQRAGLGVGLIMMGLVLAKFFIYDTLQMAHEKMAKVSVLDGIVCFAPFSIVVGIIILVHTLMNKAPDTTLPEGKGSNKWQLIGLAIALPILAFYVWFRFELSRLGYPFFGR